MSAAGTEADVEVGAELPAFSLPVTSTVIVAGAIAFVLKGYPRLSETFIANEIQALEMRGLDIRIVSLRYPTDTKTHPVHSEIRAGVHYLPEYLYRAPRRLFAAWRRARSRSVSTRPPTFSSSVNSSSAPHGN